MVVESPRSRDDLSDWTDEQAALPIDPEHGPAGDLPCFP